MSIFTMPSLGADMEAGTLVGWMIKAGDTVWIPPGEEHWHGASAYNSMVHIAIQEALNGRVAEWLEKVSDEDYSGLAV
mgnify:CR=1 FL=1